MSAGMYRLKQGSNRNKLLAQKNIKVTNNKRKHSPFPDKSNIFEDEASAEYIINKASEANNITKKDEIVQRARPVSQRKVCVF